MFADVLAVDTAYGSYNRKLAKITNLQTAVYWNEISSIITKVVKKNTFSSDGYFKVDRKYIESQTTLSIAAQYECDLVLNKLGIIGLHPVDKDFISTDCKTILNILLDDDIDEIKKISKAAKISKTDKAEGKKAGIIARLQEGVLETDADLLQAYRDWILVAYEKGICRSPQVKIFQDTINAYSNDRNVKLEIIKICTNLSYRDASWGITQYEKKYGKPGTRINATQKTCSQVNDKFEF